MLSQCILNGRLLYSLPLPLRPGFCSTCRLWHYCDYHSCFIPRLLVHLPVTWIFNIFLDIGYVTISTWFWWPTNDKLIIYQRNCPCRCWVVSPSASSNKGCLYARFLKRHLAQSWGCSVIWSCNLEKQNETVFWQMYLLLVCFKRDVTNSRPIHKCVFDTHFKPYSASIFIFLRPSKIQIPLCTHE